MNFLKILSGAVIGTSLMTLFSYYLSYRSNKEFEEPELLNKLIHSSRLPVSVKKNPAAGWILHYSVGTGFTVCYHFIWKRNKVNPIFKNSTLLGGISGIIGISGWHLLFMIHSNPPSIYLRDYYLHLLAAHIVFGWGAATGYKLFDQKGIK
ncbi:hypothetical protein BH23BAC3_BH23BAC3_25330 [soil metagenome]